MTRTASSTSVQQKMSLLFHPMLSWSKFPQCIMFCFAIEDVMEPSEAVAVTMSEVSCDCHLLEIQSVPVFPNRPVTLQVRIFYWRGCFVIIEYSYNIYLVISRYYIDINIVLWEAEKAEEVVLPVIICIPGPGCWLVVSPRVETVPSVLTRSAQSAHNHFQEFSSDWWGIGNI